MSVFPQKPHVMVLTLGKGPFTISKATIYNLFFKKPGFMNHDREGFTLYFCVCVYIYIYIYIYELRELR